MFHHGTKFTQRSCVTTLFSNNYHNKGVHGFGDDIIIPDVCAANILMNAHAKLSDYNAAWNLLLQMEAIKLVAIDSNTSTIQIVWSWNIAMSHQ